MYACVAYARDACIVCIGTRMYTYWILSRLSVVRLVAHLATPTATGVWPCMATCVSMDRSTWGSSTCHCGSAMKLQVPGAKHCHDCDSCRKHIPVSPCDEMESAKLSGWSGPAQAHNGSGDTMSKTSERNTICSIANMSRKP